MKSRLSLVAIGIVIGIFGNTIIATDLQVGHRLVSTAIAKSDEKKPCLWKSATNATALIEDINQAYIEGYRVSSMSFAPNLPPSDFGYFVAIMCKKEALFWK